MNAPAQQEFDAIVIGAGLGGLRMLWELNQQGLSARALEAGTDVGGTWYWNRYPGARTDSDSHVYCLSFDRELLDEWDWSERYPSQPEVLEYVRHVADRYNLREQIEFESRVASAEYDEARNRWTVRTEDGREYECTYLISASGILSVTYSPPFPGLETFRGEWHHTGRWPKEPVDFTGKRVGLVGTGATGVQVVPLVAQTAARLDVFQRTANYVLPGRNVNLTDFDREAIRGEYEETWNKVRNHFFALAMEPTGRMAADLEPAEQQRILERAWELGGFRMIFDTFDDVFTDLQSNEIASEFVRQKIRSIVKDQRTAELLCPTTHPIASKRPPLGHGYYETFNRDNVNLIDISSNEITEIVPEGIRLADGTVRELDIIIFATGFDAATGSLTKIDVRGRDGVRLADVWADGARAHLGIAVAGFPNMFMIGGPGTPFANIPPIIENNAAWIGGAIAHLRQNDLDAMEATEEAMDAWAKHLDELLGYTVLDRGEAVRSWFLGANIPGKTHQVLFHFGGAGLYFAETAQSAEEGYSGFRFAEHAAVA